MRFVLVHGGRSGPAAWRPVADILVRAGHAVDCPGFSAPETASLADHVAELASVLGQGEGPVVLAAHSQGGMAASEAARECVGRLWAMVFLDAAVPDPGQSLFDIFRAQGLDPVRDFGLEPLSPFTDPSRVDWKILRPVPKIYALCSRSEFLAVSGPTFDRLSGEGAGQGWRTTVLDCRHAAMAECPGKVAALLSLAAKGGASSGP